MAKRNPGVEQISLFDTQGVPDTFRKPVQIIHSKPKKPLSLIQRKIGNAWLANAVRNEADEDGWWTVSNTGLATDIGFDSNNRKHLHEAARALMSVVFEWDVVGPAQKRTVFKASVLFPEVEVYPDKTRYQISAQMRERVLQPEIFALIDMNIVRKFRRASSVAIWEHCVRFEKIGRTSTVDIQLFREMILGEDPESKIYEEYKYFKGRILLPSITEINTASEHEIALHEERMGKRVTAVWFTVRRKVPIPDDPPRDLELLAEMSRIAVPTSEARRLLKTYSTEAVRGALAYTRNRQSDKKLPPIDKPAAYFRNALSGNYAQTANATAGKPAEKFDIEAAFLAQRKQEAEGYFRELEVQDQTTLILRYNEQQPVPAAKVSTTKKKTSPLSLSQFYSWLALDTWGAPTADDMLEFARSLITEKQA